MARPTSCTPETTKAVVDALSGGAPIKLACSFGRIHESTYHAWVARGTAALEAVDDNLEDVPDTERPFAEFHERTTHARNQAKLTAVALIREAAQGQAWEKTKTTTVVKGEGKNQVVTTTSVVEKGVDRDWRAAAWMLERSEPQQWGRLTRTEITHTEDGEATVATDLDAAEARALDRVDELGARRKAREDADQADTDRRIAAEAAEIAASTVDPGEAASIE